MKGKHIVVGVCGGIAAYKTASLVRLFVKAGAEVQVVMTPSAREFITPLTMSTLSRRAVITEFFTANTGEWHSHVDLGLWADAFVVAPATACTLGKMVAGIADNMLVTSYLSTRGKVFVAPAMDLDMMSHPSTRSNLEILRGRGVTVIEPRDGELASALIGKGRMEEPEGIYDAVERYFSKTADLVGKRILITVGPTYEKIDPVRFIGNYSTGKMGCCLADEAAERGAEVVLVSGPMTARPENGNIRIVRVESALEMLAACEKEWPSCDAGIMAAAVADYRPEVCASIKIKREESEIPELKLVKNPDIAATLGQKKREGQLLCGFALETNDEMAHGTAKMKRKNLDMIVVNSLKDEGAGFGVDTNVVTIIHSDGRENRYPLKSKREVATDVIDELFGLNR
ncbi:MAG: bifunctional phosphopantothenoylcysteine decarboxylase/phosphopantothenate--cysteine ligase CoaBC [Muribaculaceae bacterium]|nr:bifunctional phosphopantothenoylcysteine decarboxylase/phosphopantothenate--cysteine ligase CoaBC [Muribaculaceae bacterium]